VALPTRLTLAVTLAALAGASAAMGAGSPARGGTRVVNPYEQVNWEEVDYVHSFSHQHGRGAHEILWDMGFRHLPISDYYPSRPVYPLPEAFAKDHPEAIGAPNAEHHATTDSAIHFNALGSLYCTGYGQTPKVDGAVSPVEHVFTGLNVFDAKNSRWLGVYRLDIRIAPKKAGGQAAAVMTVDGALEVNRQTFELVGDGQARSWRLDAKWGGVVYLRAERNSVRVRLEFDPATTRVAQFRLMQGANRPWREAFRAALDGRLKDAQGRPVEGLLYSDGGGITINHPGVQVEALSEMLDFDERVLGIEAWNQRRAFGSSKDELGARFYQLWDESLRTGRRCFGFFAKDHAFYGRGRNVLLLRPLAGMSPEEREREALRAYREGRFFGLLGAMAVDKDGKVAPPYDLSQFRFSRITLRKGADGAAEGMEVAVAGADKSRRPNTQIRFVTDAGVARVASGDEAFFAFPRDENGAVACRYVRVEAFAFPNTHLGGKPLKAEAVSAMGVQDIARLHDKTGDLASFDLDPVGQSPIAIVDMIFSQAILFRP